MIFMLTCLWRDSLSFPNPMRPFIKYSGQAIPNVDTWHELKLRIINYQSMMGG